MQVAPGKVIPATLIAGDGIGPEQIGAIMLIIIMPFLLLRYFFCDCIRSFDRKGGSECYSAKSTSSGKRRICGKRAFYKFNRQDRSYRIVPLG
jgi:hypothetical protein